MSHISGDQAHLRAATAAMRPVASSAGDLAQEVPGVGSQAAWQAQAAGSAVAARAISALADALARAVGDTQTVVGQLSEVTRMTASDFEWLNGGPDGWLYE